MKNIIHDGSHWLEQVDIDDLGYYKKCSSCQWIGNSDFDLDICPKCGNAVVEDAALVFGGLFVFCMHSRFYLWNRYHDAPFVLVDTADATEVADFIAKRAPR
jgi:hypothetical protein